MINIADYLKTRQEIESENQKRNVKMNYRPQDEVLPQKPVDIIAESDGINYGFGREIEPIPQTENATNEITTPATRQRIAPNQPITSNNETNYANDIQNLNQARGELADKNNPNYQPVVNKNKGFKGRLLDILREAGIAAGQIAGQGGSWGNIIGGAISGGLGGGIKPEINEMRERQREIEQIDEQIKQKQALQDWLGKTRRQNAETQNIYADNERQKQQADNLKAYRDGRLTQADQLRESNAQTARMRIIAAQLNKQPFINVDDPQQASLIEAAQAAGLPVTNRQAKLNIKPVQDAETGEWSVVVTNPYDTTTKPVSVPVTISEDGKRFISKSATKVMAEAGLTRQNDQQEFTAQENDKNRKQARELAMERIGLARQNLALAQQRLANAQEKDRASAALDLQKQKESVIKLKAYLKNSKFIGAEDPLFKEIEELEK